MSDQFIGVDVGGTKIAVAVLEGGELSESRIVADQPGLAGGAGRAARGRDRGLDDRMTRSVGIGMPSIIEFATGKILASSTSRCTTSRCASS